MRGIYIYIFNICSCSFWWPWPWCKVTVSWQTKKKNQHWIISTTEQVMSIKHNCYSRRPFFCVYDLDFENFYYTWLDNTFIVILLLSLNHMKGEHEVQAVCLAALKAPCTPDVWTCGLKKQLISLFLPLAREVASLIQSGCYSVVMHVQVQSVITSIGVGMG